MNTWQAAQRIKNVLKSLRWGGTGDPIFGRDSVFVTQGSIMGFVDQMKLGDAAGAFVKVGSGRADDEVKDQWTQTLSVFLMVAVPGDQLGEAPLIGRNRTGITGGGGRGLLEVEVEMLAAIEQLDRSGQFSIGFRIASKAEPFQNEDGYHLAREYAFEAELTRAYQYMAPLAVAASGDPTVTISWTAPDVVTKWPISMSSMMVLC